MRSAVSSGCAVQTQISGILSPPKRAYAHFRRYENRLGNIFGAPAGTEELGHLEMVGTILYQLTRSMTPEQIKRSGYDTYFVDHTAGVFPQFASGTPWTAATIGVTGDVIADLSEDMSAEQKARKTYDNILRLCDDPGCDGCDPLPARA